MKIRNVLIQILCLFSFGEILTSFLLCPFFRCGIRMMWFRSLAILSNSAQREFEYLSNLTFRKEFFQGGDVVYFFRKKNGKIQPITNYVIKQVENLIMTLCCPCKMLKTKIHHFCKRLSLLLNWTKLFLKKISRVMIFSVTTEDKVMRWGHYLPKVFPETLVPIFYEFLLYFQTPCLEIMALREPCAVFRIPWCSLSSFKNTISNERTGYFENKHKVEILENYKSYNFLIAIYWKIFDFKILKHEGLIRHECSDDSKQPDSKSARKLYLNFIHSKYWLTTGL